MREGWDKLAPGDRITVDMRDRFVDAPVLVRMEYQGSAGMRDNDGENRPWGYASVGDIEQPGQWRTVTGAVLVPLNGWEVTRDWYSLGSDSNGFTYLRLEGYGFIAGERAGVRRRMNKGTEYAQDVLDAAWAQAYAVPRRVVG